MPCSCNRGLRGHEATFREPCYILLNECSRMTGTATNPRIVEIVESVLTVNKPMAKSARTRDAKGKFMPGCMPGPGRPTVAREEAYLELLRRTVDLVEWEKAVRAVLAKAKKGDLRAFEALAKFIMPLPAQRLKISDEPQDEYRVAGRSPAQTDALMGKRLMDKILQRRKYEADLREMGIDLRAKEN